MFYSMTLFKVESVFLFNNILYVALQTMQIICICHVAHFGTICISKILICFIFLCTNLFVIIWVIWNIKHIVLSIQLYSRYIVISTKYSCKCAVNTSIALMLLAVEIPHHQSKIRISFLKTWLKINLSVQL